MKKLLAIFLTTALLLTLTACGGNGDPEPEPRDRTSRTTETTAPDTPDNPDVTTADTTPDPDPEPTYIEVPSPYADLTIGQTVTIGTNYDDNTPMTWRVIDIDEDTGRALVLATSPIMSDVGYLTSTPVVEDMNSLTPNAIPWHDTWLRNYLNNEVFNQSFPDEERDFIVQTTVTSQECRFFSQDRPGGISSEDYLFVLSLEEIEQYFSVRDETLNEADISLYYAPDSNNRTSVRSVKADSDTISDFLPDFGLRRLNELSELNLVLICGVNDAQRLHTVNTGRSSLILNSISQTNFKDISGSWIRVDIPALEIVETTVMDRRHDPTFGRGWEDVPVTFTSTNRLGSIVRSFGRGSVSREIEVALPLHNVDHSPLVQNLVTNATPAMWIDMTPRMVAE
jgi:predicted small lipoprotein YifL